MSRRVRSQDFLVERVDERVAAWMSERTRPRSDGKAITLQELHADYQNWCAGHAMPGTDAATFAAAFDQLREMPEVVGKIRKFGTRYYGIGVRSGGADV